MVTHHACITRCGTIPYPSDSAPCAADGLMRRRKGCPRRTQRATVRSGIGWPIGLFPGGRGLPTPASTPDSKLPGPPAA